ncbi:MAG: PQQ-binding-like beta-propeller repeat protein [Opitutales bacterium]
MREATWSAWTCEAEEMGQLLTCILGCSFIGSLALGVEPTTTNKPKLDPLEQWGQWRGPLSTGEAPKGNPPLEWSEKKNLRWKTAIPGSGHASPIVWGDQVFLLSAVAHGEKLEVPEQPPGAHNNLDPEKKTKFVVLALSRRTGEIIWEQVVRNTQPHQSAHESGTWASASPVTDGERVYAFFGSNGLYCLSVDGKLLWERDFGDMQVKHGHGEGASPALHGDTLVVNWDHEGDSFVVALDAKTGKERWRQSRDEVTTWATPVIVVVDGKPQAIVSGSAAVRGYDLATGKIIWSCGGLSQNVVASPVAADGLLFAGSSYEKQALMAIRLTGAKGDLTGTHRVLWSRRQRTSYVPSPLLYRNHLYFLRHYQAILTRLVAKSGEEPSGPFRLPGLLNLYASPVAAAGRIYLTDQQGVTLILDDKAELKVLGVNRLDETINASAAIAGNQLFLRGAKHLYCIGVE